MACSEDVERVFNEHQRFEVSGSRVDLWEPAEPEDSPGKQIVTCNLRDTRAAPTGQDTEHEKSQQALPPLVALMRRFIQPLVSSSQKVKH
jgi:hypothetical protein